MPGFEILCKEVIGENVIIKSINTIGARDNSYSEAIGMIRYFIDKLNIRGKDYTMFDDDKYFDLVENKRNNINNGNTSVFGKLFGYLFDNKEDLRLFFCANKNQGVKDFDTVCKIFRSRNRRKVGKTLLYFILE